MSTIKPNDLSQILWSAAVVVAFFLGVACGANLALRSEKKSFQKLPPDVQALVKQSLDRE